MTLKLLSYNIRYGGIGREEPIAAVIRQCDADIVVLQEATDTRVVARVAELSGMKTWAARSRYSMGFLSRVDIARHEWYRPPGARHPFLEIVPERSDIRIFGVHLTAVHSRWTEERRTTELRALLRGIAEHRTDFHVLVGDFNALSPGERLNVDRIPPRLRLLVWLSGGAAKLKQKAIRTVLDAGYVDGYRRLHADELGFTFPAWDPHVRLDYVFLPTRDANRLVSCEVVASARAIREASDHFPLLASLDVA